MEADKLPSAAERFGVQVAPTTVFLHGDRVLAKVEGADPSALAKAANTELRPLLASNAASAPSVRPPRRTRDATSRSIPCN